MVDKNPFSAVGAAVELQARKGKTDAAIEAATKTVKKKKKKGARKKEAPSVEEIKKTEHTGSEGETGYGQRIDESPMAGGAKTRFNQTGQSDAGEWDD